MKIKIIILVCIAAVGLSVFAARAQAPTHAAGTPWSLNDCINYALEVNATVQQSELAVENSELQLQTARLSRLPNLSASVSGNANFAKAASTYNPSTQTYISIGGNSRSGSLSVSSSIPVFEGMRINNQIKGRKLDLAAAVADMESVRENLSISIMVYYLEVLYSKEMLKVAENQLSLSTLQAERSRQQVAAGKLPESARYESEALQSNDELSLTQARNNLQQALLNLSQALNRPSAEGFDVVVPVYDSISMAALKLLGSAGSVYDYAVENRPIIRAEQLRLESSENSVKIAKSYYYPSLSLSGGYGTGVGSGMRNAAGVWEYTPFGTQLSNSSREYIGLSLSIPIFNGLAARNNVRASRIAVRSQQIALNNAELALRKEIEQAWYNADAAYSKYRASETALASATIAFKYEQEKADAGRSTVFDFNDAKTRMERAAADLVQSKYAFVFRIKILDFYRGQPLTL